MGRSGKVTFRARLEPVQLSGAKITYATLHNADFISQGGYAPGAQVLIKRSGEVIPAIIGLHEPSNSSYLVPEKCPCGYDLSRVGPDLFCLVKVACAHKDQESLVYFVQTLEILGVSDKIVARLREAGLLAGPADLFRISVDDLLGLEGFAKKSAENVVRAIQEKRRLPLATFLTALGLKRGGEVKCKDVARRYGTLEAVRAATPEDLASEKGWATKSAEDFLQSLHEKADLVESLLQVVAVVPEPRSNLSDEAKAHPYFGKSICITGALSRPREDYKKSIEALGAKLVSSVTSKTDFLVSNEASGSSKYQQAQKLGIPVVNEEEFAAKL
jgi:DNA ligase (NAD+)